MEKVRVSWRQLLLTLHIRTNDLLVWLLEVSLLVNCFYVQRRPWLMLYQNICCSVLLCNVTKSSTEAVSDPCNQPTHPEHWYVCGVQPTITTSPVYWYVCSAQPTIATHPMYWNVCSAQANIATHSVYWYV